MKNGEIRGEWGGWCAELLRESRDKIRSRLQLHSARHAGRLFLLVLVWPRFTIQAHDRNEEVPLLGWFLFLHVSLLSDLGRHWACRLLIFLTPLSGMSSQPDFSRLRFDIILRTEIDTSARSER
jgi:hypothetical protein